MNDEQIWIILIPIIIFIIWLFTKSWFWLAVTWIGGISALFAMLASIIHFQILSAVGFFLLMQVIFGLNHIISLFIQASESAKTISSTDTYN